MSVIDRDEHELVLINHFSVLLKVQPSAPAIVELRTCTCFVVLQLHIFSRLLEFGLPFLHLILMISSIIKNEVLVFPTIILYLLFLTFESFHETHLL